jgi:hypothetical protein
LRNAILERKTQIIRQVIADDACLQVACTQGLIQR